MTTVSCLYCGYSGLVTPCSRNADCSNAYTEMCRHIAPVEDFPAKPFKAGGYSLFIHNAVEQQYEAELRARKDEQESTEMSARLLVGDIVIDNETKNAWLVEDIFVDVHGVPKDVKLRLLNDDNDALRLTVSASMLPPCAVYRKVSRQ